MELKRVETNKLPVFSMEGGGKTLKDNKIEGYRAKAIYKRLYVKCWGERMRKTFHPNIFMQKKYRHKNFEKMYVLG